MADEDFRSVKMSDEVSVKKSGEVSSEDDAPRVSGRKRKLQLDFSTEESWVSAAEQRTMFRSFEYGERPDLEDVDSSSGNWEFGDESSSTSGNGFFRDSEEVASPPYPPETLPQRRPWTPLHKIPAQPISPSAEDLENFFTAAENYDHKHRFAVKYNYDIVADAPLEGRYLWVRLKP